MLSRQFSVRVCELFREKYSSASVNNCVKQIDSWFPFICLALNSRIRKLGSNNRSIFPEYFVLGECTCAGVFTCHGTLSRLHCAYSHACEVKVHWKLLWKSSVLWPLYIALYAIYKLSCNSIWLPLHVVMSQYSIGLYAASMHVICLRAKLLYLTVTPHCWRVVELRTCYLLCTENPH